MVAALKERAKLVLINQITPFESVLAEDNIVNQQLVVICGNDFGQVSA